MRYLWALFPYLNVCMINFSSWSSTPMRATLQPPGVYPAKFVLWLLEFILPTMIPPHRKQIHPTIMISWGCTHQDPRSECSLSCLIPASYGRGGGGSYSCFHFCWKRENHLDDNKVLDEVTVDCNSCDAWFSEFRGVFFCSSHRPSSYGCSGAMEGTFTIKLICCLLSY